LGQTYFVVQTRQQELADEEAQAEGRKRLLLRQEMTHSKRLAGAAKEAGMIQPVDHAISHLTRFQEEGEPGVPGEAHPGQYGVSPCSN
jgi:DNA-damage-inducible protein D